VNPGADTKNMPANITAVTSGTMISVRRSTHHAARHPWVRRRLNTVKATGRLAADNEKLSVIMRCAHVGSANLMITECSGTGIGMFSPWS
jgi:hypothetical protein